MIVTGIERQKKHPGRYSLFVDGEFVLAMRAEVLVRSGLRKGDEVTGDSIGRLVEEERLAEAMAVAARYIGRRRRTEEEIRRKLSGKEVPPEVTEKVIGSLTASNLVNDEDYVRAFIHDAALGKPAGSILLCSRLKAKGVSREILMRVVPECLPPGEEAAAAKRLATAYDEKLARSAKKHPPAKKRALILRYLAQRGFTGSAREDALRHVCGQWSTEG